MCIDSVIFDDNVGPVEICDGFLESRIGGLRIKRAKEPRDKVLLEISDKELSG